MSPIAGFVKRRKHQFGRQASFGTKVAATRAYPFSGVPSVDLAWTDREIDTGSVDPVAAPYRGPEDLTASLTDPALEYNTVPLLMEGFFGGNEVPTGGGTAQTWTHEPASETVDPNSLVTYEFGDDVLTDWYQLGDGLLESVEITGPEELGPLTTSMSWRFGSASSTGSTDSPVDGTVPTPGLAVDPNGVMVYLKDLAIYISDTVGGIGAGLVTDALHAFVLRFTRELDLKRFADGDQTFDIDEYGTATRAIELECTWAKTADTVGLGSESDDWFSDESVTRYIRLLAISTAEAESGVPYSWQVTMPMRYYTREEGDIGGNTTVVLTAHAFLDTVTYEKVFQSIVVNTLTEDDLGAVGS